MPSAAEDEREGFFLALVTEASLARRGSFLVLEASSDFRALPRVAEEAAAAIDRLEEANVGVAYAGSFLVPVEGVQILGSVIRSTKTAELILDLGVAMSFLADLGVRAFLVDLGVVWAFFIDLGVPAFIMGFGVTAFLVDLGVLTFLMDLGVLAFLMDLGVLTFLVDLGVLAVGVDFGVDARMPLGLSFFIGERSFSKVRLRSALGGCGWTPG